MKLVYPPAPAPARPPFRWFCIGPKRSGTTARAQEIPGDFQSQGAPPPNHPGDHDDSYWNNHGDVFFLAGDSTWLKKNTENLVMFIRFVFHFYRICRDSVAIHVTWISMLVTPPFCSLVFVLLAWTVTFEWQNHSIIFLKPPFYSTKPTLCIFLSAKLILSLCKTDIFVSKTDI